MLKLCYNSYGFSQERHMKMKAFAITIIIFLAGCQMNNQTAGTVIGGGAGGLLGSTVGGSTNQRLFATGVGTLIGAAAGSAVGASMDQRETVNTSQMGARRNGGSDVCARYRSNEGAYSACQRGVAQKNADEQRRLEEEAYNQGRSTQ